MAFSLRNISIVLFSIVLVMANTMLFAKEISFSHQHGSKQVVVHIHDHKSEHHHHGDAHDVQTAEHTQSRSSHCDRHPESCAEHKNHSHAVCFVSCSFVWLNQKSDLQLNLISLAPIFPATAVQKFESNFQSSIFRPPI